MKTLVVLWTDNDKIKAENMVFMYTINSKLREWWKDIIFIIWGSSTKLAFEDEDIQNMLKKMIDIGIDVKACKACADNLGATDKLIEMGIDVDYMGVSLTEFINDSKYKLLTL